MERFSLYIKMERDAKLAKDNYHIPLDKDASVSLQVILVGCIGK